MMRHYRHSDLGACRRTPAPTGRSIHVSAIHLRDHRHRRGSLSFRLQQGEGKGFYSIIAVPIMSVMMIVASRTEVIGEHRIRGSLRLLGWLSTAVMTAAAGALLLTF